METTKYTSGKHMVQQIAEELLNVTQQAAIASYPWIGKGNKIEADGAGTKAMRHHLNKIDMCGRVVIGEGEMDEAPMLYINEILGSGNGPEIDIAVDPVEGTTLMSKGKNHSMAVLAAAKSGSLLHAPDMYMKKIAVGPGAKGCIDLNASLTDNMISVAKALGKDVKDLTIMIQDRDRHTHLMAQVLELGAKLKLFSDVDITGAIATGIDGMEIDMLVGTGGAPEGVITATAMKCLGGDFQGQLVPMNQDEYDRCVRMGIDNPTKIWQLDEIVRTNDCLFSATAITDGIFLDGVKKLSTGKMCTHSLLLVGADTRNIKFIQAYHQ